MQKTKDYTLIVRGVTKSQKNSLKRLARARNQSVNGYMLTMINGETKGEVGINKLSKK